MRYLVVYEQTPDNWAAYAPDVPGCVATGATREETARLIGEALAEHLALVLDDGLPLPQPSAVAAEMVDVEPARIRRMPEAQSAR